MHTSFVAQPHGGFQLGTLILELVAQRGTPREMTVVSAFAALTTVHRVKEAMEGVAAAGGSSRLVLGVDMGGTSREVLQEVASWGCAVVIVKNAASGTTFHPKIFHLAWDDTAEIIVGSNNLTEGGFFRNYEAATRVSFSLPADAADHARLLQELDDFLRPGGEVSRPLTPDYLARLLALPLIPSEAEARERRAEATRRVGHGEGLAGVFGRAPVPNVPRLPAALQAQAVARRAEQRAAVRRAARALRQDNQPDDEPPPVVPVPPPEVQFDPTAFLMTLPRLRNAAGSTPGEVRVPLSALELAMDFWGWPDNYGTVISPRGGANRVYREWRSPWRVYPANNPATALIVPQVRLYFYENSSDFRFYARQIVNLGANTGDIVRIRRVDEADVTFDCAVAIRDQGMMEWGEWDALCVNQALGGRRFGFV